MANTNMSLEDAMRVADIFEADDIISVPAMAGRILVAEVRRLQEVVHSFELKQELKDD